MRISMSKRVEGRQQTVIMTFDGQEMLQAVPVIQHIVGARRLERTFDQATGRWKYLFAKKHLDDLLLAFPTAVKSTGLQRKLDKLNARALEDRAVDPFVVPNLWDRKNDCAVKPFDYQYMAIAECVRFILGEMDEMEHKNFVEHFLENDEMGLGKTLIMLCTILMIQAITKREWKILVVAPKNGKFVWRRENARWADLDLIVVDADEMKPHERSAAIRERRNITVINPEMLRGQYDDLFDFEYDLVVLDEYHRFGSPTTLQSQGLMQLQTKRWLPMSGTPYLTRPTQLWVILHLCWPTIYPDFALFKRGIEIYAEGASSGKVVGYSPTFTRALKSFMDNRSIRRRKDQVLADLPEAMPIDLPVELNREQRRIYNQIRDKALRELEDGKTDRISQSAIALRLKQACFSPELFGGSKHSAKIDELMAYVESLMESNEKAIIFSEWAKATRILQREFKQFNCAYVDGSVTGANRMAEGDRFNNDDNCRLYIGTIGANREAVSLGAATTVIFTDKDPSPQVNAQAAGRSAAGGLRGLAANVNHVSLVSMWGIDTYEDHVKEDLAFKQGHFTAIIDNDGGPRSAQHAIEVKSLRELM